VALSVLIDRIDLTESGIRVPLKVPIPKTTALPVNNATNCSSRALSYGHKAARHRDASGDRR
jgi:hypothetical protein